MGLFTRKKDTVSPQQGTVMLGAEQVSLAEMVLNYIAEGVLITDATGAVQMLNPAAISMIGCAVAEAAVGVNVVSLMKFENGEGLPIEDKANLLLQAVQEGKDFQTREYVLVTAQDQRHPIAITLKPVGSQRIITFRDITKELEEEGAQMDFISTASHEMRTPVASIEGYLGLALNPRTATIDDRARKYLEEAHASSQHLGRLFQDLLDITKLDDKKVKVKMVPVELTQLVREIADGQMPTILDKGLKYTFGANDATVQPEHRLEQMAYASVDVDFLREILNNLIENAVKYTPAGGAIWVNVRGDGDRVLINVTDTGIGIASEDVKHIFQKFYRVDNSQTRTIGGTGLGLYLVKQRVEAIGGRVWVESSFGEGSTFYVSLPRLTAAEYDRRRQVLANQEAMQAQASPQPQEQQPQTRQTYQPFDMTPQQQPTQMPGQTDQVSGQPLQAMGQTGQMPEQSVPAPGQMSEQVEQMLGQPAQMPGQVPVQPGQQINPAPQPASQPQQQFGQADGFGMPSGV